jgi:hypothetical protein
MKINSAEFVISNQDVSKCPTNRLPEYALYRTIKRRKVLIDQYDYRS